MGVLIGTDTSFHLGFKSINDLRPAELGISDPNARWLIATSVVGELDEISKQGIQNKSKRAGKEKALIVRALEGREQLASGIPVVRARDVPDMTVYPFDSMLIDNRILASYLRYAQSHPEDDVYLVADDDAFRLRASDFDLRIIDPPEVLRLPDVKDKATLDNERLRAELNELKAAAPILSVHVADAAANTIERTVYKRFEEASLAELIETISTPEEFVEMPRALGLMLQREQRNEAYEEQLGRYRAALDPYLRSLHEVRNRTLEIKLVVRNGGLRTASDIHLDIAVPPTVHVASTPP